MSYGPIVQCVNYISIKYFKKLDIATWEATPPAHMGWMLTFSFPAAPCTGVSSLHLAKLPKGRTHPSSRVLPWWQCQATKLFPCPQPLPPRSFPQSNLEWECGSAAACTHELSMIIILVSCHYQMPDSFRTSDSDPRGRACSQGLSVRHPHWDRCPSVPWDPPPCWQHPQCSWLYSELQEVPGSVLQGTPGAMQTHSAYLQFKWPFSRH